MREKKKFGAQFSQDQELAIVRNVFDGRKKPRGVLGRSLLPVFMVKPKTPLASKRRF